MKKPAYFAGLVLDALNSGDSVTESLSSTYLIAPIVVSSTNSGVRNCRSSGVSTISFSGTGGFFFSLIASPEMWVFKQNSAFALLSQNYFL